LHDIKFDRAVVTELFVLQGGQIGKDTKAWPGLLGGADFTVKEIWQWLEFGQWGNCSVRS